MNAPKPTPMSATPVSNWRHFDKNAHTNEPQFRTNTALPRCNMSLLSGAIYILLISLSSSAQVIGFIGSKPSP